MSESDEDIETLAGDPAGRPQGEGEKATSGCALEPHGERKLLAYQLAITCTLPQ